MAISKLLHKKTSLSETELWEASKGLEEMNLKEMFTIVVLRQREEFKQECKQKIGMLL